MNHYDYQSQTLQLCIAAFFPTINTTAEYLSSEADGAVDVPRLRVDADETGNSGNGKECEHRSLWVLVSFKDL